jgi:hypothetical protein
MMVWVINKNPRPKKMTTIALIDIIDLIFIVKSPIIEQQQ